MREFSGILYPEDREAFDYKRIHFTLPEGYTFIEIEYDFDRERGCIIDIGLIDSRDRFRGWSGSSRSKFYVGSAYATPGYIAGEMPPGNWSVVLGLARVVECGCRYRVIIRMYKHCSLDLSREECNCIERKGSRSVGKWVKGDLHTHTTHSDGRDDVCSLISKAVKLDLDYIAITDHNTVSQVREIAAAKCSEILVVPGIEITTYYGHINTWGTKWFDFRRRSFTDFKNLIDEIHREGLLASLNHPFHFDVNCIGCDFKYKELRGFDLIEVWNGPTPIVWNAYSVNWWHNLLVGGANIPIVGGSDYHGGADSELATPTTWVYVDRLTVDGILNGIRKGRVFLSKNPNWRISMAVHSGDRLYSIGDLIDKLDEELKILIEVESDSSAIDRYSNEVALRIITAKGIVKLHNINTRLFQLMDRVAIDSSDKFVRVEIGRYRDPYSLKSSDTVEFLLITNPIYVSQASTNHHCIFCGQQL